MSLRRAHSAQERLDVQGVRTCTGSLEQTTTAERACATVHSHGEQNSVWLGFYRKGVAPSLLQSFTKR